MRVESLPNNKKKKKKKRTQPRNHPYQQQQQAFNQMGQMFGQMGQMMSQMMGQMTPPTLPGESFQPPPSQEGSQTPTRTALDAPPSAETFLSPLSTSISDSTSDYQDSIDISVLVNCLHNYDDLEINWNKIKDFHIPIENSVVNLSNVSLSTAQISLLSKGLSFCPMPGEPNLIDLKNDLFKFERNLKWKLHFANQNLYSATQPGTIHYNGTSYITIPQSQIPFESIKFKNKSERPGPIGPPTLETLFLKAHSDLDDFVLRRTPLQNLTREEHRAIFELKNNPEIVIKKADKGSAIVVMNTIDYITQCLAILDKDTDYERLDNDPSEEYRKDIEVIIHRMYQKGEITESVYQYLNRKHVRTARFYALPKIHKFIQYWDSETRPPMRQIAGANQSPTERPSQFCDHFLNPIMKMGRSYLIDTTDFLWKTHNLPPLPQGACFVVLDVNALYPSIPLQDGIRAVTEHLNIYRTLQGAKPSNQSIITLLEQVLTKNCLVFNGRHYRQIKGTAMGTKVAPAFANIFMNDFEDKYVYTYHIQPMVWF